MKKSLKALIISLASALVIAIIIACCLGAKENEIESFRKIKSENEYDLIFSGYKGNNYNEGLEILKRILTFPASLLEGRKVYNDYGRVYTAENIAYEEAMYDMASSKNAVYGSVAKQSAKGEAEETLKNYSTTNIQVENVDEGDSLKTDGKYIYTINNDRVYVVDASNAYNIKKVITLDTKMYPEDLLLGDSKLVVIGRAKKQYSATTQVTVYDKDNDFKEIKDIAIEGEYETSRMIGERVIVVTDMHEYYEDKPIYRIDDNEPVEMNYKNIFYNEKYHDYGMTYMLSLDLSDLEKENAVNVYGCSIKSDAVYASESNLYLIKNYWGEVGKEDDEAGVNIGCLFGLKGAFGLIDYENDYNYSQLTKIVKLSFDKNNEIDVKAHRVVKGRTINQFSFDEKDGFLRLALCDTDDEKTKNASTVLVLDKNLREVGKLSGIAENEDIYATRFIGNRLYLVTYLNMDPLFVIDLTNNKPTLLGELEISGYSRYLHPYDDNHIIGIGVETETKIERDAFGRVISEYDVTLGLKMALFDVTDVKNPKEISKVVIGDQRTTSDILENHKTLLFSKEKGVIAIPVTYRNYSYNYDEVKNGFTLYNVSVENGLSLRGNVYHENINNRSWYSYSVSPVRGMYINNYLFTISDDYIKVNGINTLSFISKYIFEK